MAQRIVVGPVVVLPDSTGKTSYFYKDVILPDGLDEERVRAVIADGLVAEVTEDKPAKPARSSAGKAPANPEGGVPTIKRVIDEVGDDPDKAASALAIEQASEKPRQTLVDKLTAIVASAEPGGDGGNSDDDL